MILAPTLRARLFGGAALALMLAGAAQAQEPVPPPATTAPAAPVAATPTAPVVTAPAAPTEGGNRPEYGVLGEQGFYLEAEQLSEDDANQIVTATGAVEARYQGRTVRARQLRYDRRTGRVTANGDVRVINPDGTVQFADEVELDEDFRAGIAIGFSTRLEQNVKIAAARAIRRSDDVQELDQAIFTPCNVCVENGEVVTPPTFSISAERIIQDRRRRVIVYRNAVLRVFGTPVMALPFFAHADPTAERASGFLIPRVRLSDRRGFSYEQPYVYVISPSADIVISPQINTKVNPFLNLDYRQRFYSGDLQVRLGYTYEEDFDGNGERFGTQTNRSYILARGDFDFNEDWSWGFSAERVSDDTLFDRYAIQDVFDRRGLYQADSRRLLSQVYVQRQDSRSYFSAAALSFQGLRPTDNDATFPNVAPLFEYRWEPNVDVLGGRIRLASSGAFLTRSDGADSRRATADIDWRAAYTLSNGVRIEPFAFARADGYLVNDWIGADDEVAGRASGVIGADISWPFVRVTPGATYTLEPLAQISLNGETDIDDRVPNEDSLVFELDETNLFRFNRFPGFDRFEDGLIATVGGRATARLASGQAGSLFIGRTFRSRDEGEFPDRSGLRSEASDWVVRAEATPIPGLTAFARARFDDEDFSLNRSEVGLNASFSRVNGSIRYLYDDADITGVTRHDIEYSAQVMITERFGVIALGVRDLEADVQRYSEIGVVYQDECVRLELVYERDNTQNRALGPSDSVALRLTIATLGGVGYRDFDTR